MSISDYVSSHEVDGRACAEAYKDGSNKFSIVAYMVDHLDMDAETAWLVVEAIDAYEDLRDE